MIEDNRPGSADTARKSSRDGRIPRSAIDARSRCSAGDRKTSFPDVAGGGGSGVAEHEATVTMPRTKADRTSAPYQGIAAWEGETC